MSGDVLDFSGIKQFLRGALYDGKFRVHQNGLSFKSDMTGKLEQLPAKDIATLKWLRVAYHYELQVITKHNSVFKYDGFQEKDFDQLKRYLESHLDLALTKQDLSVRGWNSGQVEFHDEQLSFNIESKPAFEIPLRNVTKCELGGKNEVALEFHQNDDADVELVEMRFYVPNSADPDQDLVQEFHDSVMKSADILSATGTAIMSFDEVNCAVPKGRHEIKFFPTCIQMRGKTNIFIVQYTSILRLFLLPHNDGNQIFLVISLDPPLKHGATRYHFVIFQFFKDEEMDQELALSEEEIKQKYEDKLQKQMSGPVYEIISKAAKTLANKKITVPGHFKGNTDKAAIFCGYKANTGYMYPLERGFLYLPKPPLHIRFDEIAHVNFARGTGTLRSFDFEITTKQEQVYHFTQIERGEYNKLFDFVKGKNLNIKNIGGDSAGADSDDLRDSDEESDGGGGSRHDPYLERMKKEGEGKAGDDDSDEDDEDFAPPEEEDVAEEYDSNAEYVTSDEDEEGGGESKPKKERRIAKTIAEPGMGGGGSSGGSKKKSKSEGEPSSKKKKKEKDPNMPKRPQGAYFLYIADKRDEIKTANPDAKVTDIGKIAGEMWRNLDAAEKKVYTDRAAEKKAEYDKIVASMPKSDKSSSKEGKSSKKATKAPISGSGSGFASKEFISSDESSSDEGGSGGAGSSEKPAKKSKPTEKAAADTEEKDASEDEEEQSEDEPLSAALTTKSKEDSSSEEDNAPLAPRSTRGRGGGTPLAEGLPEDGEDEPEEEMEEGAVSEPGESSGGDDGGADDDDDED